MTVDDAFVSVIVPVHNGERFVAKTLESALTQTYRALEIIIVDDGSTDSTAMIVRTVAASDSRIRYFYKQKSGVAAARNFGISQAKGTLIAMLDADDLWHPEKIARQVELIKAHPNVGLVYCWPIEIDENDSVIPSARQIRSGQTFQGRVTKELASWNFIGTSSVALIRRACIEEVGGYDTQLKRAEDWKLYLALSEICEFGIVEEYLVGYRQSTGSLSTDVEGMAGSTGLVVRWLNEKWPDLPEEIGRARTYRMSCYLAARALIKNQFRQAFHYRAVAYRARSGRFPDRSEFEFLAHAFFRMTGLRRAMFKPRESLLPFQEFLASRKR